MVISLETLLDIFVQEKTDQQTPAEWRAYTFKKFSPPSVQLRAYSGHKLNIMSQLDLTFSYVSRTTDATVLVQDRAPHNLLLRTDLHSKLGFTLVAEVIEKTTDLLTGDQCPTLESAHFKWEQEPRSQDQTDPPGCESPGTQEETKPAETVCAEHPSESSVFVGKSLEETMGAGQDVMGRVQGQPSSAGQDVMGRVRGQPSSPGSAGGVARPDDGSRGETTSAVL